MASSLFGQQTQQNSQSNLISQLMAAARAGKSPQEVLPQLARQHPVVKQAMDIISGNAPQQVTGMIQHMAAQRGVTIPQLMQRLGIK